MKTFKQLAAKAVLGLAAFGGVLGVMAAPGEAQADPYGYHYFTPRVYVPRVYVPRVYVPRYIAPEIQIRAYHPAFEPFEPFTPDEPVLIHGSFHFDAPYVSPVLLPW